MLPSASENQNVTRNHIDKRASPAKNIICAREYMHRAFPLLDKKAYKKRCNFSLIRYYFSKFDKINFIMIKI